MVLDCQSISKSFGINELFNNVSFHINDNEKVALIGVNGCGKTTLLKIITGEISADLGQVIMSSNAKFSYLAQHQDIFGSMNIYDYVLDAKKELLDIEQQMRQLEEAMPNAKGDELEHMMSKYSSITHSFELANGYALRSEVTGILKGLGFDESDFNRSISTLSGGQKTRLALGKSLLSKPDLLILDEPTNHLDINSTAWLENYLLNYQGAVLIVSHDRFFLDKIVSKVVEIDNKTAMSFEGNYTQFSEKKAVIRRARYNAYINQQHMIKHQEEVITKLKSFNREKSIKRAESREKALEKIDIIDKPVETDVNMHLKLSPNTESGKDVLSINGLSKSFDNLSLFKNQSFDIYRGERVALIGNNGTGKTTILKIINGLEEADSGTITLGSRVHIGYYDQEHQVLDMAKTIFDEIHDAYPDMTETQIRNVCAAFLFTGDDVFVKIGSLSGGERGRVSLAKLMLSEANFLILDEPTNHLDMYSREILEDALCSYTGTVLYVSHDRYFINRTATRILELEQNTLIPYIGNYDYYLEKKEELTNAYIKKDSSDSHIEKNSSSASLDWKAQKEELALKRKKENDIKKTEHQIELLEDKVSELNDEINLPENADNHVRLTELTNLLQTAQDQLNALYEKWEELSI